ncbi:MULTISPECIES: hypothetical protein [Sphingobium]|nr:hypothetical protein [Sphingobium sp. 15-1]
MKTSLRHLRAGTRGADTRIRVGDQVRDGSMQLSVHIVAGDTRRRD